MEFGALGPVNHYRQDVEFTTRFLPEQLSGHIVQGAVRGERGVVNGLCPNCLVKLLLIGPNNKLES